MSISVESNHAEDPDRAKGEATSRAPKVSIGLPVYNGDDYLEGAIESLLSQTFEDLELVISDNASTDRTEEICRRYAAQDPRVHYRRNHWNIGGMRNANLAFARSRGEYFRLAAHDDRCAPTMVERLVAELDARPDVTVCCSAAISIDADGDRLPGFLVGSVAYRGRRDEHLLFTDNDGVRCPTEGTGSVPHERARELLLTFGPCEAQYGLIRSDVLRRTDVCGDYTSSDRVMLFDLALRGRFHVVSEPLFFKRWHTGNRYHERGPGRMVWSRPELAESGRPTCPHWLQLKGYVTVLRHAPISWSERLRCVGPLARWARLNWRPLAWDLAFAGIMLVHSKEWRRQRYDPRYWTEETL